MTREEFTGFADEIIAKEEEKKAINAEIKEAKEKFAEKHNLDKESIKKAMKEYKAYLKDQGKFTIVDKEVSEIIEKVVYPTATTTAQSVVAIEEEI